METGKGMHQKIFIPLLFVVALAACANVSSLNSNNTAALSAQEPSHGYEVGEEPSNQNPATVPFSGDTPQNMPSMPIGEVSLPIDVGNRFALRTSPDVDWLCAESSTGQKISISGFILRDGQPCCEDWEDYFVRFVENNSNSFFDVKIVKKDGKPGYYERSVRLPYMPELSLQMFSVPAEKALNEDALPCNLEDCRAKTSTNVIRLPRDLNPISSPSGLAPCN